MYWMVLSESTWSVEEVELTCAWFLSLNLLLLCLACVRVRVGVLPLGTGLHRLSSIELVGLLAHVSEWVISWQALEPGLLALERVGCLLLGLHLLKGVRVRLGLERVLLGLLESILLGLLLRVELIQLCKRV